MKAIYEVTTAEIKCMGPAEAKAYIMEVIQWHKNMLGNLDHAGVQMIPSVWNGHVMGPQMEKIRRAYDRLLSMAQGVQL